MWRLPVSLVVIAFLFLPPGYSLGVPLPVDPAPPVPESKLSPALASVLTDAQPNDLIAIIVVIEEQADLPQGTSPDRARRLSELNVRLQAQADRTQPALVAWLRAAYGSDRVNAVRSFWIFNGFAASAAPEVVLALARRPDVARIELDATIQGPGRPSPRLPVEPLGSDGAVAPNLVKIGAPALWDLGIRGQGVVVATVDSGVTLNHPALSTRWRGGTNSWYDPYGEHPTPFDSSGHGTMVTGIMVAGDESGVSLGVAPDAAWIAVKIWNDRNQATTSAIHAGLQWLLDPDDDPLTPDAPHVVVNSWTRLTHCDLTFEPDLAVLRAAGILPVFAAGNFGPNASTDVSPPNNPSAFAVGATDNLDQIYLYSSRGPSACGEAPAIYPEVVAPGVDIMTTALGELYASATGTSMAAPHVAGALALLLSTYPRLSVDEQAALLVGAAQDLGEEGPDNTFGYGRLDVWSAYLGYVPPVYRYYFPLMLRQPTYPVFLPLVVRSAAEVH